MRIVLLSLLLFLSSNVFAETIYTEDKLGIAVTQKDTKFVIKLRSNLTTGYAWFLRTYDTRLLTPVKHTYEGPTDKKLMGAPGYELWTFQVKREAFTVPQQTLLRFVYSRPWDGNDQSKQVVFRVSARAA